VNHRILPRLAVDFALLKADQERAARDQRRDVAGIPAIAIEEQILVLFEAEQGHRQVLARGRVPPEQNGIFPLDIAELGRESDHAADVVPELGGVPRDHPEVGVGDVVEQSMLRHRGSCVGRKKGR
jgi:hypothetical protein